jgi:hypothetical protein
MSSRRPQSISGRVFRREGSQMPAREPGRSLASWTSRSSCTIGQSPEPVLLDHRCETPTHLSIGGENRSRTYKTSRPIASANGR